ncbi:ArgS-related anticodon-binding protein NrtL [Streptomyces yangpuensis]|uniref:ArgS-related anticodon-binding protein NrtL n=1 Tax=Streptomyces yangpuensis TaxID=1648182 RepID=UPI003435D6AE
MTPADLSRCVVRAVRCAVADGELAAGAAAPERVVVERTRPGGVGDYATPVAFQVAKAAGCPPRDVAGVLARRLGAEPGIERVEVTGAGFLNFVLPAPSAPAVIADAVMRDLVIRDVCRGAGRALTADESRSGPGERRLRERVVRQSILRLLHVQGGVSECALPAVPATAPPVALPAAAATPAAPVGDPPIAAAAVPATAAAAATPAAPVGDPPIAAAAAPPNVPPTAPAAVPHTAAAAVPPTAPPAAPPAARPADLPVAPVARPADLPVAPVARRDGDVVARYGADAARWAMLAVPARETPSFSDVLLVQGEASEVFRVRYAHARSRALLRNAAQLGFRPEPGDVDDAPALLRLLADHPLVLEAAAHHRAPERLTRHLVELADALLDFQYRVLPQGDEKPSAAHRARLALAEAAGTVLAGGLTLLGMDAPERL